jgi:hypothetical protein
MSRLGLTAGVTGRAAVDAAFGAQLSAAESVRERSGAVRNG